jgi:hypothetical protein
MKRSMQYVLQPVLMSLDAANLKSEWKGTLYIALVKLGCNEIVYPVAVARIVLEQNENLDGWRWFLTNLDTAALILSALHSNMAGGEKEVLRIHLQQVEGITPGGLVT